MPKLGFEAQSGVAEGELAPSLDDLKTLTGSCLKRALSTLAPHEKTQLLSVVQQIRSLVVAAADLLGRRRAKIKNQISVLEKQLAAKDTGTSTVSKFFKLMAPAIDSCSDGQAAASQVKTLTDRALAAANELTYQISLAKTREGLLIGQAADADKTLGTLDRINLLLR